RIWCSRYFRSIKIFLVSPTSSFLSTGTSTPAQQDSSEALTDLRNDWWKPLHEKERPASPGPTWTIPSSNVSDIENNWATALVSAYETLTENSLLAKPRDMTNFLNWYCR
nr:hypothetical protein [Tanacetum cinerariifolium]